MQIAIVDPSRTVRRIVGEMVSSWGHSAVGFCNGEQAISELLQQNDIRALITSAELPGCSGLELCRSARSLIGAHRPLYILFMSSMNEREKTLAALESGADDFIAKPPCSEELKARLRAADRVTSLQATLARQAITDALTESLNRRGFFEHASQLWKRAADRQKVSALILDIDRFKTINDEYGHAAGDEVLVAIARQARELGFSVGRVGGEEFAILLERSLDEALDLAERLRVAIESLSLRTQDQAICPTCSIGLAESEPGDTIDSLLRRADMALYEAKRQGRNRMIAADTYRLLDEHRRWKGVARTARRGDVILEEIQGASVQ